MINFKCYGLLQNIQQIVNGLNFIALQKFKKWAAFGCILYHLKNRLRELYPRELTKKWKALCKTKAFKDFTKDPAATGTHKNGISTRKSAEDRIEVYLNYRNLEIFFNKHPNKLKPDNVRVSVKAYKDHLKELSNVENAKKRKRSQQNEDEIGQRPASKRQILSNSKEEADNDEDNDEDGHDIDNIDNIGMGDNNCDDNDVEYNFSEWNLIDNQTVEQIREYIKLKGKYWLKRINKCKNNADRIRLFQYFSSRRIELFINNKWLELFTTCHNKEGMKKHQLRHDIKKETTIWKCGVCAHKIDNQELNGFICRRAFIDNNDDNLPDHWGIHCRCQQLIINKGIDCLFCNVKDIDFSKYPNKQSFDDAFGITDNDFEYQFFAGSRKFLVWNKQKKIRCWIPLNELKSRAEYKDLCLDWLIRDTLDKDYDDLNTI